MGGQNFFDAQRQAPCPALGLGCVTGLSAFFHAGNGRLGDFSKLVTGISTMFHHTNREPRARHGPGSDSHWRSETAARGTDSSPPSRPMPLSKPATKNHHEEHEAREEKLPAEPAPKLRRSSILFVAFVNFVVPDHAATFPCEKKRWSGLEFRSSTKLKKKSEIRTPQSSTSNSTRHQTSIKLPENVQSHRRFPPSFVVNLE
jgi:hypothetical protein